jgi:hypothetical protein
MVYLNRAWALICVVALAATAVSARADTAAPSANAPVAEHVSARPASGECGGLSGDDALRAAQQAQRNGLHPRAAECFRAGGDLIRSHRALIRASADTAAVTSRKAALDVETAKAQARRLRAAFR